MLGKGIRRFGNDSTPTITCPGEILLEAINNLRDSSFIPGFLLFHRFTNTFGFGHDWPPPLFSSEVSEESDGGYMDFTTGKAGGD